MERDYILKETEKAIMVKGKFENCFLDGIKERTFWIPKKCLDENGNVAVWFMKSKIQELFTVSGTIFVGLVKIK